MNDKLFFEDFSLEDTIGHGTVGTIFRARHQPTDALYALKLLSPAVSRDAMIRSRFEREVMILSKLKHPSIVSYFGSGNHDGQLFYVMELLQGGTLKEVLKWSGQLTWIEAAECGRQMASALQHAHNHGIIHRDLKPGNVFLTEKAKAKLGDFGIARDLHSMDLTDVGLTVGTYAYMAPEMIRGERNISGSVDLYALGCVMFEMLTGRTPFLGDNFAQIFEQHLKAVPPTLHDLGIECPHKMDDIVSRLLKKDPNERPFNARAVQGVLGELTESSNDNFVDPKDRSADSVRPGQRSLMRRLRPRSETEQIGWAKLAMLLGAVIVVVAILAVVANYR